MFRPRPPSARPTSLLASLSFASMLVAPTLLAGCGSPGDSPADLISGTPDGSSYDPSRGDSGPFGSGGSGGGGGGGGGGDAKVPPVDAAPSCVDDLKRCAATFTYPAKDERSVELRGDFREEGWMKGEPMVRDGTLWKASVPVPYAKPVHYKYFVDGKDWVLDPTNPKRIKDGFNENHLLDPITCTKFTCDEPPTTPPGVFDWRDAVIYFVFVDRFFDGDKSNNCPRLAGVEDAGQYQGGDWVGVTKKINEGYFTDLGVNTLWVTVPVQNDDDYAGLGVGGDTHRYSSYHGYWPRDLDKPEKCFGTKAELTAMVDAAHAKKLKVLFDYAMVHVTKNSSVYRDHNDWFWSDRLDGRSCICGSDACKWEEKGDRCWFTDYLPHWNYTNKAARDYSVDLAMQWIKDTGADGYRLDAIKHVDGTWLTQLRERVEREVVAAKTPAQRFYMVGETFDYGSRDYIKSFVDPKTKLDGQFDFPLRLELLKSVVMRQSGMDTLAGFMDSNDGFYGASAVMSTWIGNHDIARVIHFAEDRPLWDNPYADGKDKAWSGRPELPGYRAPFERLANAFAVLLTNKGAPLIYYGDEIGHPGAGDPDNRRFMSWDGLTGDQTWLRERITKLTAIRAAHPALRRGKRATLKATGDLWVYSMTTTGDTVYVAVNRGDGDQTWTGLPAPPMRELLTGVAVAGESATIPPRQTRVFASK